ncbi:hypothetical protein DVT68_11075 [Dyella solisilvae]|uniref:Uncharacterized protein n=1 Tax=Dyella solisilvae TaxID=1920168 RepID=A0A370K8P8_9GAMM|nr:hypothetical protein [Dyella solisilvae]RDI99024.1 hypothetical protein DVT68_11075 [Dyella solisilvae]
MAKADKIISAILLTHGAWGCAWAAHIGASYGYPLGFLIPNMTLALAGVIAGTGCFLGKRWAANLGLIFWSIQLFQILTPAFRFSFTLGLNAVVSVGWFGFGQIGLNLFALAMLWWLAARTRASGSSFCRAEEVARI